MANSVTNTKLEWTNLLLGSVLFCSAFMFGKFPVAALSAALTGLLIVTCSAVALYRFRAWAEWSNIVLGSWAVVAPYLLGFGSEKFALSIHIIIGFSVAAIATLQFVASRDVKLARAQVVERKYVPRRK